MKVGVVAVAVAVFGLGWGAGQVFSQDAGGEKKPEAEKPAEGGPSAEEMAAWVKYMTPGEPHKKMAALTGDWVSKGKFWMKPDAPPTESAGTSSFKMVYNGLYQVQEYKGAMMGMPFEGTGVMAFDNASKKYVGVWYDSMSTGLMYMEGSADATGKVVTMSGQFADPMDGKPCALRMVTTDKDADTFLFEMYAKKASDPAEAKCMEMTYTRKK